jgi:hypothetical protein
MRVFIGYGYNERDRWVEEYVIPKAIRSQRIAYRESGPSHVPRRNR